MMHGPMNVKFICLIFEVQGSDKACCKLNCLTIEYGSERRLPSAKQHCAQYHRTAKTSTRSRRKPEIKWHYCYFVEQLNPYPTNVENRVSS